MTAISKRASRAIKWPSLKLCLLLSFLFLSFSSFAQTITLSLKNAPLINAFQEIEKKTNYRFVYMKEILETSLPVTIELKQQPISRVLEQVFKDQPLEYSIDKEFVMVRQKEKSPSPISIDIQGKVINERGEPLIGATVSVQGKRIKTASDGEGIFYLNDLSTDDVLTISNIGYVTQTVAVKDKRTFLIQLALFYNPLEEQIVIAYGTTTRRFNTGSVGKVTSEQIAQQPISNPLAALQGRVPGLLINQTSGVPGAAYKVEIRGQSVLDLNLSRNDPLIIVDGIPFEAGNIATNQLTSAANNPISISQGGLSPLNTINPLDIESIEVLKDADATAIYGSRGANGVILITTKKAKASKTQATVNFFRGWSTVSGTMPLLQTAQYRAMRREAFYNEGQTPDATNAPDLFLWDSSRYTDFKKLLIGNTARVQAAQTTLSGGNASTQFLVSGNYRRETNVFSRDLKDQIGSVRFHLNHQSDNKKFIVQLGGAYSSDKNQLIQTDLTRYINLPPNLKLQDGTGKLVWEENGVSFSSINYDFSNPLAVLQKKYNSINSNLLGNLVLSYKLLSNLTLRTSAGYNQFTSEETSIIPSTAIDPSFGQMASSAFANAKQKSWILEPQVEWEKQLLKGKINLLLGSTLQRKTSDLANTSATNYTNDLLLYSLSAAGNITSTNNQSDYRYLAFFGRLHYNWLSRYVLNITGRRDGSSRFAPERRFSNFGAIGAAWILSEEKWFKKVAAISFGKLRGSYGVTGNDQIGDYRYLNLWSSTSQPYNGIAGLLPKNLYNPTYNWERNRKLEAALELGFLNNNLNLSVGYYRNRTSNQLVNYVLPSQTGFFSVVQNLPALVQNTGLEIMLSANPLAKENLKWSSSFDMTIPKNKLISFPELASSPYASQYVEGKSLSIINRLKYIGVNATSGLYDFEDVDGDGFWTEKDFQYLGHLDPVWYGGFSNTLSYKNLSFSFLIEYKKQKGRNYLSQLARTVPGTIYNQPTIALERWQKPGTAASVQRFTSEPFGQAYTALAYLAISDGIYSDASYARLKNAYLAFQLPVKAVTKAGIKSWSFYMQAQNLFVLTNYKGSDPETQSFYMLPPLKTITLGTQINF